MHYCSSICQILFLHLCEMHNVLWLLVFFFLLFSCQLCPGFQNYKSVFLILKSLNMVVRRVEILRFLRKNWCKNWHYHFHATYDHQIWLACTSRGVDSNETNQAGAGEVIMPRSYNKQKLYLHYQSTYDHHTWRDGNWP